MVVREFPCESRSLPGAKQKKPPRDAGGLFLFKALAVGDLLSHGVRHALPVGAQSAPEGKLINAVVVGPLSAQPKKSPTKTHSKGHALICSAAALLSLRENRTTAPQALPCKLRIEACSRCRIPFLLNTGQSTCKQQSGKPHYAPNIPQ